MARTRTRQPAARLPSGRRRRSEFERVLGYRPTLAIRLRRAVRWLGIGGYTGAIALVTAALLAGSLALLAGAGAATPWLIILGLLAAIPLSDSAVAWSIAWSVGWSAGRAARRWS